MKESTSFVVSPWKGRSCEPSTVLKLTRPFAPDGPLCAELRGVVDGEILRRALRELVSLLAREDGRTIILDLHDVESRCSLIDFHTLGDELGRLGFQTSWRMAIVGSPVSTGLAILETIAESHGLTIRLFKDQDAAYVWLRAGS